MVRPRQEPSPEQLDALRGQIQDWRERRKVPGPMPGELWEAAVALAKGFGVCRMARALKRAIMHRKNSLFYRSITGARTGDTFMSLIHSAELNGVEPFEYLVELLKHPEEVRQNPSRWMPWSYPAPASSG